MLLCSKVRTVEPALQPRRRRGPLADWGTGRHCLALSERQSSFRRYCAANEGIVGYAIYQFRCFFQPSGKDGLPYGVRLVSKTCHAFVYLLEATFFRYLAFEHAALY